MLKQVQELNLWELQADITPAEGQPRSVQEIETLLNDRWESYLPRAEEADIAAEGKDSESTVPVRERRGRLLESYKTIVGGTSKPVYDSVAVDKSDFYRWLRGELPPSSDMTGRIEQFIKNAIGQKRRALPFPP